MMGHRRKSISKLLSDLQHKDHWMSGMCHSNHVKITRNVFVYFRSSLTLLSEYATCTTILVRKNEFQNILKPFTIYIVNHFDIFISS